MSSFTIGDFATALNGVAEALNGIAEELGHCDANAEIDNTPGKKAICQVPVVVAQTCVAPPKDTFTVADLVETVEGLRDWIGDVRSKLANYDAATLLDAGTWPPSNESTSA